MYSDIRCFKCKPKTSSKTQKVGIRLEGMVRFQTPCSKFQVRVVRFNVRVVDFNCRVDIVECATVVILCPTAMA